MTEAATGGTRVRMIPATVRRCAVARPLTERLRVAAYARVSTDDEEQQTSYEAQVDYYTKKIRENPEWIFVEVYADEGITGTSTKRRKNFNRMIDDRHGRHDRPDHHQIGQPLRPQHRGHPDDGPQAQGKGRGRDLREGKHRYAGQQGRAVHHDHVVPCAGGEPLHLGKRDLGLAQAHRGRQGVGGLLPFPRLRKRPGRQYADRGGRGQSRARDLRHVSGREDALRHCGRFDEAQRPHACGKGDVAGQHGKSPS